jgi:hypothetical protein
VCAYWLEKIFHSCGTKFGYGILLEYLCTLAPNVERGGKLGGLSVATDRNVQVVILCCAAKMVFLSFLVRLGMRYPLAGVFSKLAPIPTSGSPGPAFPSVQSVVLAVICGTLVEMPVCFLVCQWATRWMVRNMRSRAMACILMLFVGDLLLEAWDTTAIMALNSVISNLSRANGTSFVDQDSSKLRRQGVLLQAIHLFYMVVGAYLGQRFLPVALTGSIATGSC